MSTESREPGSTGGIPGETEATGRSAGETEPGAEFPHLARRALLVFVNPGRLFAALRERPTWLGAVLLLVVLNLAAVLLMPQELMEAAIRRNAPADAPQETIDQILRFGRIAGYVASVVLPFLLVGALAGLLAFVFNLILAGEAGFRQLSAVCAHALVIPSVGALAVLPLMIAAGDPDTQLALHLLLPIEEGYLYRLLHGLNVFSLWTAVVLGIGVSELYPRRTVGQAASVLLGLYLAFKAVVALFGG